MQVLTDMKHILRQKGEALCKVEAFARPIQSGESTV